MIPTTRRPERGRISDVCRFPALLAAVLLAGCQPGAAVAADVLDVLDHCEQPQPDCNIATAVSKAIAASEPGQIVRFPAGVIELDAPVVLRGGRSYVGSSRNRTVVRLAKDIEGPGFFVSATLLNALGNPRTQYGAGEPVRLSGFRIDGGGRGNRLSCLVLMNWRSVVDDMVVENCTGNGIEMLGPPDASGYKGAEKNVTEPRVERSFIQFVEGHGLYVGNPAISRKNQVTDGYVVDTVFRRTGGDGMRIEHSGGWVVRGNHLYVVHGDAINVSHANATSITDNYIEGYGRAQPEPRGRYAGIAVTNILGRPGWGPVIIANNRIKHRRDDVDARYVGILALAAKRQQGAAVVSGNVLVLNGRETGIRLGAGSEGRLSATVTGNIVDGASKPLDAGGRGVRLETAANIFH